MSGSLAGKIAFVTGGARGIGRANALKLAGAGCDVAIAYHNSHEEAEAVCKTIQGLGRKALAVQADVADPESLKEAFEIFRKEFNRVDIVVSNAAIGVLKPAMELTLKHFRRCMETNALALNSLAQNAVPMMPEGGCIIGLSSLGSVRAIPHYAFIGASKAALESLARGLAQELGHAKKNPRQHRQRRSRGHGRVETFSEPRTIARRIRQAHSHRTDPHDRAGRRRGLFALPARSGDDHRPHARR